MRTNFDWTPYRRNTVGFDRLFDYFENANAANASENYPPFDIERLDDDGYRITIAVAGFKSEDIDITAHQNHLTVAARRAAPEGDTRTMLYSGIATRAFERRFQLADFVRVEAADLADGLLSIELVREVPEAMKPRKIIVGGGSLPVIGDQREAA